MEPIRPSPVIPIQAAVPPSAPPASAPRVITPAVRRLIWLEPRVRRWWLFAVLIFLTFAGYAGDRLWARAIEKQLIRSGTLMKAKIQYAETKSPGHPVGPIDVVQLQVTWPDQTQETLPPGNLSQEGIVGGDVMIHIDPNDHAHWTDRTQPIPLLDSLLIGMLLLPLIPVVLAAGFMEARRLQATWKSGLATAAVIFDRKQSPIAPMSYALRCSLHNSRKKGLFTVYVPRSGQGLEKGDLIWVVTPTRQGRPVAALWMAGGAA